MCSCFNSCDHAGPFQFITFHHQHPGLRDGAQPPEPGLRGGGTQTKKWRSPFWLQVNNPSHGRLSTPLSERTNNKYFRLFKLCLCSEKNHEQYAKKQVQLPSDKNNQVWPLGHHLCDPLPLPHAHWYYSFLFFPLDYFPVDNAHWIIFIFPSCM